MQQLSTRKLPVRERARERVCAVSVLLKYSHALVIEPGRVHAFPHRIERLQGLHKHISGRAT